MVNPDQLTNASVKLLEAATQIAQEHGNSQLWPAHVLSAFCQDGPVEETFVKGVVSQAGGNWDAFDRGVKKLLVRLPVQSPPPPAESLSFNPSLARALNDADSIAKAQKDSYIAQDHLLLALLKDPSVSSVLSESGLTLDAVKNAIRSMRGSRPVDSKMADASGFDALKKYAVDLTKLAEEGKLDPVIGRDNEVRRMIRILCRRTKNNPVLIGEPGVGKTALAELLAQRIVKRDVPASLLGRVFSLDMGALMAGAKYKGEYEERVKSVLNEIEQSSEKGVGIILFIDEMHLLMAGKGDGDGGMDAANLLKPMLARGKLRCIGATTLAEYRKYIEKDAAFERRFAQVLVNEPTVDQTVSILRGISEKYEVHHGVRILDGALYQAAHLAHRYLTSKRLPDSAIDLVDEACANVRVSRETAPEAIDNLERRKLQLEVEIHALSREKDDSSKERLRAAKKAVADIESQLGPLRAAWEQENSVGREVADTRRRLDELSAKADDAERRRDLETASDLRYYAIPDLHRRLQDLERAMGEQDAKRGGIGADTVTPEAIAEVVSRATNIPVGRLVATEKEKLIQLERYLAGKVVGQPEAVKAVANAIRLSRSGLANENRPIASFLLAGPSGTGKTLLAKTLAEQLFDSPDAMIRIDGSEYSEKHAISRLVGAPPGYVGHDQGGTLTEYIRRRPYSIVLIDEIEKASREFVTLFLQVLDDGRITDGQGRVVDFKNTVIIMTSNLGAEYLNALTSSGPIPDATRGLVMHAIEAHFPPEFRNRIDDIIIYRPLTQKNIRKIVEIRLEEFTKRLAPRKLSLDVESQAKDFLASTGYSTIYGARPLNRVMQDQILNPLAMLLLQEKVLDGERVKVRFDSRLNRLWLVPNHRGLEIPAEDMDMDDEDVEIEEMD